MHKYLSRMWAEFYCRHALWFTKLKIVTSKRSEITASKSKHQHLETIALVTITKSNTNSIENKLLVKSDSKKKKSYLLSSLWRQFLLLLSALSGRRGMLDSLEMRARIKLRLWKGSIGVLKSCLPTSGKCREISKIHDSRDLGISESIFSTLFLLVSCFFCFFASLSLHLNVFVFSGTSPFLSSFFSPW